MRPGNVLGRLSVSLLAAACASAFAVAQTTLPAMEKPAAGKPAEADSAAPAVDSLPLPAEALEPERITPTTPEVIRTFDLSPAIFIENRGQWDESIRYAFRGKGVNVFFTNEGPVFEVLGREDTDDSGMESAAAAKVIRARFVGANAVAPEGLEPASTEVNFYIGSDPSKWHAGIPSFRKVCYRNLYEGIDLYCSGRRNGLKYEFHVAPGADWRRIAVEYEGLESLALDDAGALRAKTPVGEIIDESPVAYQETAEGRRQVAVRFRLTDEATYGFDVTGKYDPSLGLVIDPDLAFRLVLGGDDHDCALSVAVDAAGNAWVTGETYVSNWWPGGTGGSDAFIARIDPIGHLSFLCFLGGSREEIGKDIATDQQGRIWVHGLTNSRDFPTPGGFDTDYNGTPSGWEYNVFVARITPAGRLTFGSYLGAKAHESCAGMAIDPSGNVWITGAWSDGSTTQVLEADPDGGGVSVARITPEGDLDFSSSFGGTCGDWASAIAADECGNVWITGLTTSEDFPTPGGFQHSYAGPYEGSMGDAFVARITAEGELDFASYLGGNGGDGAARIAVDAQGDVWVTGSTNSLDFPTPGGFDTDYNGPPEAYWLADVFVVRISAQGELVFGSYLGGSEDERAGGIAVSAMGSVWVTGVTQSFGFPTPGGIEKSPDDDGDDAFVARITPEGALDYATVLASRECEEGGYAIDADAFGSVWLVGRTLSHHYPPADALVAVFFAGEDLFICLAPDDGGAIGADALPLFEFEIAPSVRPAFIVFSNSPAFPLRPVRKPDGQWEKTMRFPLRPGATTWTPSAGQLRAIKKMALPDGSIYWRLEGRVQGRRTVQGLTRQFYFDAGEITDLSVHPSHTAGADEAVWPDVSTIPTFTWVDQTIGMQHFYVDISTDPAMPMKDRRKTTTIGTRGTARCFYTANVAEWKRIRRLATWLRTSLNPEAADGVLYWRVRALDAARALSLTSAVKTLVVDRGDWTLPDPLHNLDGTWTFNWTHVGEGIAKYALEFSSSDNFNPTAKETVKVPAASLTAQSYTLKAADIRRLRTLARVNGVSELRWRVRGEDGDRQFVCHSDMHPMPWSPGTRDLRTPVGWWAEVTETPLGAIGEDYVEESVVVSADMRHIAWLVWRGDQWAVMLDGAELPLRFPRVGPESTSFSDDGSHFVYAGYNVDHTWASVVVNGQVLAHHSGCCYVSGTSFSPDGTRLAYATWDGLDAHVVVDGVAGPPYDRIGAQVPAGGGSHSMGPVWSPNSRHFAYAAVSGAATHIIVDGVKVAEEYGLSRAEVYFSPDSGRFGYIAWDGADQCWAVIDGVPDPVFGAPYHETRLVWSPDSLHYGYVAYEPNAIFPDERVIIDGQAQPWYERAHLPSFGADGKYAYVHSVPAQNFYDLKVNTSGVDSKDAYDDLKEEPLWSPDGLKVSYSGTVAGNGRVHMVNNTRWNTGGATHRTWSADSKTLAYAGRDDSGWYVCKNLQSLFGSYWDIRSIVVSPNSARIAYVARPERHSDAHIVGIDGYEVAWFEGSFGSSAFPWSTRLLGGTEHNRFVVWDDSDSFHTIVRRGPESAAAFSLLEVKIHRGAKP